MFIFNYLEERVKAPWPVSDREALLHYFEIEYFKEDLIIILLNTVRLGKLLIFVGSLSDTLTSERKKH